MIDKLRNRRQRLISTLWVASVALTALSVIVLAVELVHKSNYLNSAGDTIQTDEQIEAPRKKNAALPRPGRRMNAALRAVHLPQEWTNSLPADKPVQTASYETAGHAGHEGAWLGGTITDSDSDRTNSGALHDDHQSRTR